MKKNFLTFLILFIFFLMLALPSVTKNAANEGLRLWIFTVMPALLPYTIISSILLQLNAFSLPCRLIGKIFKCRLPENKIFIIICGCLCGCPIGAKVTADSYKNGQIDKSTAEFLMCVCNNLSPSFLINYVFVEVYAPFVQLTAGKKWILFIIMISSSFIGALITHKLFFKSNHKNSASSATDKPAPMTTLNRSCLATMIKQKKPAISKLLEDCILSAFEIQAKIGGYIILFTIITNLFLHTLYLSDIQAAFFGSILEVTSGLGLFLSCNKDTSPFLQSLVPSLITALTTFGGICTIFQTRTAVSGSGLSIRKYSVAKFISGIISFILAYICFC